MIPIKRLFLDLDGVIADFVGGAAKLWHTEYNDHPEGRPREYEIDPERDFGLIGVAKETFWAAFGHNFWASLEKTKEADEVLELVKPFDVTILSSPTRGGADGKIEWVRKHLPRYYFKEKYLIGPDKEACAHPAALLIDDCEEHVDNFRLAGGHAILFPRPWNGNYTLSDDPVGHLARKLNGFVPVAAFSRALDREIELNRQKPEQPKMVV